MNIGMVGLGKLGLPVALAIEKHGHNVMAHDPARSNGRITLTGHMPANWKEEGARELLSKSEIVTASIDKVVEHAEIIFIAVQTPHEKMYDGSFEMPEHRCNFDYSFLLAALHNVFTECNKHLDREFHVVVISTVLPGTIRSLLAQLMTLPPNVRLVYNPYFIAMGTVIEDFEHPEFILMGTNGMHSSYARSDDKIQRTLGDWSPLPKLVEFYKTITDAPVFPTSIENAELIKVTYNTFISMKICYINTIMEICDKIPGCDVDEVTQALALGTKRIISPMYLTGGYGDGGGCHPRDLIAMSWLAERLKLNHDLFTDLIRCREDQTKYIADVVTQEHMETGLPIALMGYAFKAETNLTDGSPMILLANELERRGFVLHYYDPHVNPTGDAPPERPHLYVIGTKHECWKTWNYYPGSVVVDPWRYLRHTITDHAKYDRVNGVAGVLLRRIGVSR